MRRLLIAILALVWLWPFSVLAFDVPQKQQGYINDYVGVLSADTLAQLEQAAQSYERETSNEIGVAIIKSLEGASIEEAANEIFRTWGIGKRDKNNGVLFMLSMDDRRMRIEVGYGLEGTLTDIETFEIQERLVKPRMRSGEVDEAVAAGVNAIIEAIDGDTESSMAPMSVEQYQGNGEEKSFVGSFLNKVPSFVIAVLFILLLPLLARLYIAASYFFGRTKSWWLGGVVGAFMSVVAAWLFGDLFDWFTFVLVAVFCSIGLWFDRRYSNAWSDLAKPGDTFWRYFRRTVKKVNKASGRRSGSSGGSSSGSSISSSSSSSSGGSSGGGGSSSGW